MGDLSVLGGWLYSVLWESFSSLKDSEGCEWSTALSKGFWEGAMKLKL